MPYISLNLKENNLLAISFATSEMREKFMGLMGQYGISELACCQDLSDKRTLLIQANIAQNQLVSLRFNNVVTRKCFRELLGLTDSHISEHTTFATMYFTDNSAIRQSGIQLPIPSHLEVEQKEAKQMLVGVGKKRGSDHSSISGEIVEVKGRPAVRLNTKNIQGPMGIRIIDGLWGKWDGCQLGDSGLEKIETLRRLCNLKSHLHIAQGLLLAIKDNNVDEVRNLAIAIRNINGVKFSNKDCSTDYLPVESPAHYEKRIEKYFAKRASESAQQILFVQEIPVTGASSTYREIFEAVMSRYGYDRSLFSKTLLKNSGGRQVAHTSAVLFPKGVQIDEMITSERCQADLVRALATLRVSGVRIGNIAYFSVHISMSRWNQKNYRTTVDSIMLILNMYQHVVIAGDLNLPSRIQQKFAADMQRAGYQMASVSTRRKASKNGLDIVDANKGDTSDYMLCSPYLEFSSAKKLNSNQAGNPVSLFPANHGQARAASAQPPSANKSSCVVS